MSRLDEALARARGLTPEHVPPVVPSPASGAEPVFSPETDAEPVPVSVSELPREEIQNPEPSEPEAQARVIDLEGDLGTLPASEKLAFSRMHSMPVEQYRRLAARLLIAQTEHNTKIVMVTSALAGEGKTLTAANLALTLSESYKKSVLLLDADLRQPTLHQVFQIPNVSGLNDGLRSDAGRKLPLIRYTENMYILTAGRPDADPMSVLSGERLRQVFEEAGSRFDWVVVDTPPVALLTDAHLLASLVDAVLLVVESGRTPLSAIKTAVQSVGRDRVFGVVLNRADAGLAYGSYGLNYYYAAEQARG